MTNSEDEIDELSAEDVGKMKRRIADLLEPGETVYYMFTHWCGFI